MNSSRLGDLLMRCGLKQAMSGSEGTSKDKETSLTLAYLRLSNSYEVKQIVNSTFYKPGDWLKIDDVDKLCRSEGWTVVMIEQDLKIPLPIPVLGGL